MNQELMTLDFWQDTVIYEDKTLPTGTLACDALNVSTDTLARMNEQCDKINLLLGQLNAAQDASALFPMVREAALTMLDILSVTPPFPYMDIPKQPGTDSNGLYGRKCTKICRVRNKSNDQFIAI